MGELVSLCRYRAEKRQEAEAAAQAELKNKKFKFPV